jgi:hypothetical protein
VQLRGLISLAHEEAGKKRTVRIANLSQIRFMK